MRGNRRGLGKCEGKEAYGSKTLAVSNAATGAAYNAYKCKACGQWHRTTTSQEVLARLRGMQLRKVDASTAIKRTP